jgi:hypothetical protein
MTAIQENEEKGGKSLVPAQDIELFQKATEEYGGLALVDMSEATKTIRLAEAIAALRSALTPAIMAQLMTLQGSRVGFKTDKDRNKDGSKGTGYPSDVVKDVVVEAVLYGARMTQNEVNIIAANCYLTKEHFIRKLRDLPGMTDLEMTFGAPQIEGDQARVNCRARWKMRGKEQTIGYEQTDPCNLIVRVYNSTGGGYDQAIGKAERKLRGRIWSRATGSTITLPEGDLEDREPRDVTAAVVPEALPYPERSAKAVAVSERLAERKTKPTPPPAPSTPTAYQILPDPAKTAPAAKEREPGCDDDKGEEVPPPQKTEGPPSYQRLCRMYDDHSDMVDNTLKLAGFKQTLPEIDPAKLTADELKLLARVAAKVASALAK